MRVINKKSYVKKNLFKEFMKVLYKILKVL